MNGVERRFWAKVAAPQTPDGCMEWGASKDGKGYGKFYLNGHLVPAHRFAYELVIGPIPEGLQLDHLCRNRACVRPDHLEPVTARENLLRGETLAARNAAKTHCDNGHPYNTENTYWHKPNRRKCRACSRERQRFYRARRKTTTVTTK